MPSPPNYSLHIRRESGRMGAISSLSTLWEACRIHGFKEGPRNFRDARGGWFCPGPNLISQICPELVILNSVHKLEVVLA